MRTNTQLKGGLAWKLFVALLSVLVVTAGVSAQQSDDYQKDVEEMLKIGVPEQEAKPSPTKNADAKLPRVLLIGDSISGGYTGPVQTLLKGTAVVQRGNSGGTTIQGLAQLDEILGDEPWDIIHFNWGLHDMTWQFRMKPGERGIEQYAARLDQLVIRLKKTDAKLIWATTTPWPDNYAYFEKRFKRKLLYSAAEEKRWQDAALAVMKKHGIPVNDLHALLKPDLDQYQKPEDVHFNKDGSRAMGEQIAKVIRPRLK